MSWEAASRPRAATDSASQRRKLRGGRAGAWAGEAAPWAGTSLPAIVVLSCPKPGSFTVSEPAAVSRYREDLWEQTFSAARRLDGAAGNWRSAHAVPKTGTNPRPPQPYPPSHPAAAGAGRVPTAAPFRTKAPRPPREPKAELLPSSRARRPVRRQLLQREQSAPGCSTAERPTNGPQCLPLARPESRYPIASPTPRRARPPCCGGCEQLLLPWRAAH